MCWGMAPRLEHVDGFAEDTPVEPAITREFIRSVCDPFYEQMLTALQQALQDTQKRQMQAVAPPATSTTPKSIGFPSVMRAAPRTFSPLDPMLDEESTEAEELGTVAFSSLLSGAQSSASDGESTEATESKSPANDVVVPAPPSLPSCAELVTGKVSEKSVMVCRHWKTKGWCRLDSEGKCKFSHPEHKRGVTAAKGVSASNNTSSDISKAAKGVNGSNSNSSDISKASRPGISTILSLSDAISLEAAIPTTSVERSIMNESGDRSNELFRACPGGPKLGIRASQLVQLA